MFSTSAISRYDSPSRSLNMIMARCGSDKVASARTIRSRSSTCVALASGAVPWSTRIRSQSFSSTRSVPRDVHHDPEEPGVEGGVAAERRQGLEGADEGILGDVPGLFGVAQHVVGEPIGALAVLLDQRLERREVA